MKRPSRQGLRAHLGEVIADAELREHALEVSAPPPSSASLTGAVTPVNEARADAIPNPPTQPASLPATTPAPLPPHNPLAMDAGVPHADEPHAQGARRRRRSASPLPPLPAAADIPDDALGRVTFFTLSAAPDVAPPPVVAVDPPAVPGPQRLTKGSAPLDQWLPVILLGAALLVVFIIGVVVTH